MISNRRSGKIRRVMSTPNLCTHWKFPGLEGKSACLDNEHIPGNCESTANTEIEILVAFTPTDISFPLPLQA